MGTCMSVQNASFLKRTRMRPTPIDQETCSKSASRTSVPKSQKFLRPINVVNDPSGDDIYQRYVFVRQFVIYMKFIPFIDYHVKKVDEFEGNIYKFSDVYSE